MKIAQTWTAHHKHRRQHGILQLDLIAALAILTIAIMPLGFSFMRERQVLRNEYHRSVITELVDGEMEILAAGAAKNLPDGSQNLAVQSQALTKVPAGQFQLTKSGNHLQLTWTPDAKCGVSAVVREATLK
jgi:hypothetical protein